MAVAKPKIHVSYLDLLDETETKSQRDVGVFTELLLNSFSLELIQQAR